MNDQNVVVGIVWDAELRKGSKHDFQEWVSGTGRKTLNQRAKERGMKHILNGIMYTGDGKRFDGTLEQWYDLPMR